MLSILCLKRKAKNIVSRLVWMLPTSSKEKHKRDLFICSNDGNKENKAIYIKNHFKHSYGRCSTYIKIIILK